MATLDILGLDPTAPQVPQPQAVAPAPVRKAAATAQPAVKAAPTAAKSASSTAATASSASRPRRQPVVDDNDDDDDGADSFLNLKVSAAPPPAAVAASSSRASPDPGLAGTTQRTASGVSYTVPHASPRPGTLRRARWTESQLSLRAAEFTDTKDLLIFAATWNVNAKKPHQEADLAPWLLHRIKCKGDRKAARDNEFEDDDDEEEQGQTNGGAGGEAGSKFKAPDVYIVGFQEIVDLNAGNLLGSHTASAPWESRILDTLCRGTGKEYVRVTTVHLVGLSLAVFVKAKHQHAVSDVRVDEVGTGIMGIAGNKGAVLIKMRLYKTGFVFINAHLAAHQGAVAARNADFWNIVRRASFEGPRKARVCSPLADGEWIDSEEHRRRGQPGYGMPGAGTSMDSIAASASNLFDSGMSKFKTIMDNVAAKKAANNTMGGMGGMGMGMVHDHGGSSSSLHSVSGNSSSPDSNPFLSSSTSSSSSSTTAAGGAHSLDDLSALRHNPHGLFGHGVSHLVWVGDLNYRLDVVEVGMDQTHAWIERGAWGELLRHDQLLKEKRAKRTFPGFVEPPINFAPTYKFITGTHQYDRREDKKVRYPSYCDRIQYMTCKPPRRPGGLSAMRSASAGGFDGVLNSMHCEFYSSARELLASDHKPVMALLVAPVVFEREKSKRKILEGLELLSDEECAPRILLTGNQLEFGVVPFEYAVTRSFQIRNVGDAVVSFTLIPQSAAAQQQQQQQQQHHGHGHGHHGHHAHGQGGLGGHELGASTKPWLRVLPSSGVLGRDATITVHVTMHVTAQSGAAQLLNTDADTLAGALLLRLDGGYVYKVGMGGEYQKSLAGSELSYLTALLKDPIRTANAEDVLAMTGRAASVPHALFSLIDYMCTKKNLFQAKQGAFVPPAYHSADGDESGGTSDEEDEDENGGESAAARRRRLEAAAARGGVPQQVVTHQMRWILEYLDTGRSLDKAPKPKKWTSPAAPAPTEAPCELPASAFMHTLLFLLASLPSPLLVASTSQPWHTGMDLSPYLYQTLLETDVEKYRTLVYVLTFAREIVAHQRLNGCHVETLSTMLGIALCHRAPTAPLSPIMPITPTNIMQHLLTSPDFARLPDDNAEHQAARMAAARPQSRYNDIQ